MARKGKVAESTEIVVLLDRSGSMETIKNDMIGGFDRYMDEQRKVSGDCTVTLVQFDSQGTDVVHEAMPVAAVPGLVLVPRGSTPLLDAMGQTINRVVGRLNRAAKKAGRVLFLVLTDGQENASHEFSKSQVKQLVDDQTRAGWQFSFLGANMDAFAESGGLGIAAAATSNFVPDSTGVRHAFVAASAALTSYRSGGTYAMVNLDPRVAQHQQSAASTMGRQGGKKGGAARAASLSPEERKKQATDAANARWRKAGP